MKNLTEADFAALRIPFESGRQSPSGLAGSLILSVPFNIFLFVFVYLAVTLETAFPYKYVILYVHFAIVVVTVLLSIIFSFRAVYLKSQKMQYFISIVISQLIFGIDFILLSIFIAFPDNRFEIKESVMLTTALFFIVAGLLLFIIIWIRLIKLLKKGEYRAESKRDIWRSKVEVKQLMLPAIMISTSFALMFNTIDFQMMRFDETDLMLIALGPVLYFVMIFILPEQLILLYCKKRFDSFNFDQDGNLIPSEQIEEQE